MSNKYNVEIPKFQSHACNTISFAAHLPVILSNISLGTIILLYTLMIISHQPYLTLSRPWRSPFFHF